MLLDKTLDENEELLRKFQELNQGSFAPKTNEASVVPSEVDQMKVNPLVDEEKLAQLQDAQSRQLRNVGLFQAADQISRSIAAGYGGKVEPTDTSLMEESAKTPLKNYLETLKKYQEARGSKNFQKLDDYTTRAGKPLIIDPNTGKVIDPFSGSPVAKEDVISRSYRILTDPNSKEQKLFIQGQGVTDTILGAPSEKPTEVNKEKDYTYEMLNPKQREYLAEVEKEYAADIKDSREFGEILANVEDLIDSDISAAIPAIQRQLARSVGREVGVMTDRDVSAFTGDRSLIAALQRFAKMQIEGKMTERDKDQYRGIIEIVRKNLGKSMENRAGFHAAKIKQRLPDASQQSLMNLLSVEAAKPIGVQSQTAPQGKIKVQLSNGQAGFIDEDKVDAFKQKYPKAKVMQ